MNVAKIQIVDLMPDTVYTNINTLPKSGQRRKGVSRRRSISCVPPLRVLHVMSLECRTSYVLT